MRLISRHPAPVAVVAATVAATAVVFLFFRPEYHPMAGDRVIAIPG